MQNFSTHRNKQRSDRLILTRGRCIATKGTQLVFLHHCSDADRPHIIAILIQIRKPSGIYDWRSSACGGKGLVAEIVVLSLSYIAVSYQT